MYISLIKMGGKEDALTKSQIVARVRETKIYEIIVSI